MEKLLPTDKKISIRQEAYNRKHELYLQAKEGAAILATMVSDYNKLLIEHNISAPHRYFLCVAFQATVLNELTA